jgi:hypothetical protein
MTGKIPAWWKKIPPLEQENNQQNSGMTVKISAWER